MKVLVINAGSSSLKYQLLDPDTKEVLAKGLCERIGLDGHIKHTPTGKDVYDADRYMPDHEAAIKLVMEVLTHNYYGVIKDMSEIDAVGHRVVHGGEKFTHSVVIDRDVIQGIEECCPLAPIHNPANLTGIRACQEVMPNTPMVAVFDTAFHQTMPPKAYMYGVPKKYEETIGVRRYGFHGTSHRYVSKRVCEFLGVDPMGKKFIICHLGNGSSLSAVKDGKCQDTSMGLTPLEGLIMGTRCGSCDPAVVQFIANNDKKSVDEVLTMMNKQSGLLGIGGKSDMRDIDAAADAGDKDAILARDMLIYGIQKYIGSYMAALQGADAIIFTAGIGENNAHLRQRVIEGFGYMGIKLDEAKNEACTAPNVKETIISTPDSTVKVIVIPTNEEIMIARDTLELVEKA